MSAGISALQGPHQVAQKLRMIGWPRKLARLTSLPFMSFSVKSRLARSPAGTGSTSLDAQDGNVAIAAAAASASKLRRQPKRSIEPTLLHPRASPACVSAAVTMERQFERP